VDASRALPAFGCREGKESSDPESASISPSQAEPQQQAGPGALQIQEPVDAARFETMAYMSMFNAMQGMAFHATFPSRHSVTIDVGPEVGGASTGPEPLELILVSLGTCTGLDVISILRKKRQSVTAYTVNVFANQAQTYPRVYTEIVVEHIITGHHVAPEAVARSLELSITKYCPVNAMLSKSTKIEHVFRILDAESGPPGSGITVE
jgi:putative redox protein